jgi:hypothetical protein
MQREQQTALADPFGIESFMAASRFSECDDSELRRYYEDSQPANTRAATKSAVAQYYKWRTWRIETFSNARSPPSLDCDDADELCRAIAQFFCETKKSIKFSKSTDVEP